MPCKKEYQRIILEERLCADPPACEGLAAIVAAGLGKTSARAFGKLRGMSSTHAKDAGEPSRTGKTGSRGADRPAVVLRAEDLVFLERLDHDLRTPLGTLAAVIELLREEGPVPVSHAEAVAVLERQLARLHSLTASLHDFSQRLGR
jgi:signal transduction histidine kinase